MAVGARERPRHTSHSPSPPLRSPPDTRLRALRIDPHNVVPVALEVLEEVVDALDGPCYVDQLRPALLKSFLSPSTQRSSLAFSFCRSLDRISISVLWISVYS